MARAPNGRCRASSAARRRWRSSSWRANAQGLDPYGVSFHVGSQQTNLDQWDSAVGRAASMFSLLAQTDINLRMVNIGGGFPAHYRGDVPGVERYAQAVMAAITRHFGNDLPEIVVEPGRSIVGDAGVIQSEVVLISQKALGDTKRWVYLDVGKFNGLAETMDESIKYRIRTSRRERAERSGGAGRPDLRQRRHSLREDRVPASPGAQGRRQAADPVDRGLHLELRLGGLQRLLADQDLLHLICI